MRILKMNSRMIVVLAGAIVSCLHMVPVYGKNDLVSHPPVVHEMTVGKGDHPCHVRVKDPYGGTFLDDKGYVLDHFPYRRGGLGQLMLAFECLSLHDDADRIRGMTSARFNEQEDRWEPDLSARTALERRGTRTLRFNAVNSQGAGATYEPTNGDPKTRDRYFAFCLRHPPVALCISSSQIARPYYKHSDLLPFAMTIIKSIEFIDKPPAPAADGSADIQEYQRVPLNRMLHTFGITTPERMASFLGNAIQETQWLQKLHEGNSAARYAPWDGRGFLQLTWPSNYLAYWDFRGRSGDISASVRTSLLEAQHSAQKSGSNAALLAVERHLPLELIKWRDDVQRATVEDASMSAGFYWARLRMAAYADQPHILERVSIATNHGPKIYYRSPSFWKTSACVNLPAALNYLYSARLNGFEARCAAYGYALAVLGEHRFPSSNQDAQYFPDSTEPGRI